jgi:hypothetical protein
MKNILNTFDGLVRVSNMTPESVLRRVDSGKRRIQVVFLCEVDMNESGGCDPHEVDG